MRHQYSNLKKVLKIGSPRKSFEVTYYIKKQWSRPSSHFRSVIKEDYCIKLDQNVYILIYIYFHKQKIIKYMHCYLIFIYFLRSQYLYLQFLIKPSIKLKCLYCQNYSYNYNKCYNYVVLLIKIQYLKKLSVCLLRLISGKAGPILTGLLLAELVREYQVFPLEKKNHIHMYKLQHGTRRRI